jgi:proteic killer suppression protein
VRKVKGYHDEPVRGAKRAGQRSVRLSRAYRLFYVEKLDGKLELVEIVEVNKHEY